MRRHPSLLPALAALVVAAGAACSAPAGSQVPSTPRITLVDGMDAIDVIGLSGGDLDRLRNVSWDREAWERLLRVSVARGQPAVVGTYVVTGDAVRFTPRFPFDPGRQYEVAFDPSQVPSATAPASIVTARVGRPAPPPGPAASVVGVYPSGVVLPENQLRMYVRFSAPMRRRGGTAHIRVLDARGAQVEDPFLPLDTELWDRDATRFTVLFDPGRVKRGILPNVQMGRPLRPGARYTLVISREWADAQGRPLAAEFRRDFQVGPADDRPIDPSAWRIEPPAAGTRAALRLQFPKPLDYGLLHSALGVSRAGEPIAGDIAVEAGEMRWLFTPREPWRAAPHAVIVLTTLEDPAGNRIGRAFEVEGGRPPSKLPESIALPFTVGRASPLFAQPPLVLRPSYLVPELVPGGLACTAPSRRSSAVFRNHGDPQIGKVSGLCGLL